MIRIHNCTDPASYAQSSIPICFFRRPSAMGYLFHLVWVSPGLAAWGWRMSRSWTTIGKEAVTMFKRAVHRHRCRRGARRGAAAALRSGVSDSCSGDCRGRHASERSRAARGPLSWNASRCTSRASPDVSPLPVITKNSRSSSCHDGRPGSVARRFAANAFTSWRTWVTGSRVPATSRKNTPQGCCAVKGCICLSWRRSFTLSRGIPSSSGFQS